MWTQKTLILFPLIFTLFAWTLSSVQPLSKPVRHRAKLSLEEKIRGLSSRPPPEKPIPSTCMVPMDPVLVAALVACIQRALPVVKPLSPAAIAAKEHLWRIGVSMRAAAKNLEVPTSTLHCAISGRAASPASAELLQRVMRLC